jgi:hypothetical protein
MTRLRTVLAATVLTLSAVVIPAGPASAAGHNVYLSVSLGARTHSEFYSYGEIFKTCDDYADGRRAVTAYYVPGYTSSITYVSDTGGAGTCASADRSYAEGVYVYFKACVGTGTPSWPSNPPYWCDNGIVDGMAYVYRNFGHGYEWWVVGTA